MVCGRHGLWPSLWNPVVSVQECFESLLSLLSWSWGTFSSLIAELSSHRGAAAEFSSGRGAGTVGLRAAQLDLEQLVYISTASLRLIRTYICNIYPPSGTYSLHLTYMFCNKLKTHFLQ